MEKKNSIWKRIWTYLIGILFIVSGIFFLINPSTSFTNLIFYVGLVMTLVGVLNIISSFVNKNASISGILNLILGLILVFNSHVTIDFISIIFAIWLIISSLSSLFIMFNLKEKINFDYKILISNILKLILGIVIITTPIVTYIFTGIVLGIIFIVIGIYVIISFQSNYTVYKVKMK